MKDIVTRDNNLVLPEIPEDGQWDYANSVGKVGSFVFKWKTLKAESAEILEELWIAREKLSVSPQEAVSASRNKSSMIRTWTDYCQEIGSSRQVVNRWLAQAGYLTMARQKKQLEAAEAEEVESTEEVTLNDEPSLVEIDGHLLLFGDNTDPAVRDLLPDRVSLAFADPPYNSTDQEWDGTHVWQQDYLADVADIVAVTPGISAIRDFMRRTEMPYRWSTSTWISNGMTRGALGFGNWMYTAIFSSLESIHRNRQDFEKVSIKTSDSHDLGAKRQKPPEYLAWLFGLLSQEGETILDPFVGAGTSLIVAHRMGRKCIGIEKDHATYQAMVKRVRTVIG